MPVVVVTDSTASLPPEVAAAHGIVVVPLQVVIGADVFDEAATCTWVTPRSSRCTT